MLTDLVENPGNYTPEELHERYLDELREVLASADLDEVSDSTDLDKDTLRQVTNDDDVELTLSDASSILAATDGNLDPEDIEAVARDGLLMDMSLAVLDVEGVASGLDGELEPREIQSKVEGRFPMTLEEYALLNQYIDSQRR